MDTGNGQKVPLKSWTQYGNDGGVYVNTLIPLDGNLTPEQAAKTTTTEVYGVDSQPASNVVISNEPSKFVSQNSELISGPSVANELFNKNELSEFEKQQQLQTLQKQVPMQQQHPVNMFPSPNILPQSPQPLPQHPHTQSINPAINAQQVQATRPIQPPHQTNIVPQITPQKMQQAREQFLQQQHQLQQPMTAAFLENFKHFSGSPGSAQTVSSGSNQIASQINPVTGFQDIPLGTLIVPSGDETVMNSVNSLQPLTHVIGENKHSVPKLNNMTVNEITSPLQAPPSFQNPVHSAPSMFKPITTGQILSPESQGQLISDTHNTDRTPNIEPHNERIQTEGFLASTPKQIPNAATLVAEPKKPDKEYPQPKNFGMDYVLQKKKEALIKQQNEIFWERNKQTGNLVQGDYPNPAPFQLKATNKSRPQWPQQPMKLKVSFEPTNEGKVEMKINGPFDQFGKKIPLASTSLMKPDQNQKQNIQNKDYQRLTDEEKSTLEKQRQRELQVEAIRNKLESKYIAPVNRNYKDPPQPTSLRPSDPLSGLRRPLVRVAIPRNINNSVIMTSHLPVKDKNGDLEKKVKTLSIKLPINVSLATVLKNIYEHMYEYYFHKRPMLGTQKEDAAAKKVIQGLIAENMKNITNIVQTKSLSQMQARQAATIANLKKLPLKTPQNSKTLMSFQNAKLNSQSPPKAQSNVNGQRNLKIKQQNLAKNMQNNPKEVQGQSKMDMATQNAKPSVENKLPATLADQKDLFKKLTSRDNKEMQSQLPMNTKTGDFAPPTLNGILVSEVPEDTDGITRTFHSPPNWRTFKGSIESYLGRLQDLQQRNKLTLHNDVVQPLLTLPLAVIADEHARRKSHLKFDPTNLAYIKSPISIVPGDLRTHISHTESEPLSEEKPAFDTNENSHQRDIKGPSLFQISKGKTTAEFNQMSQNYVNLNMNKLNNKQISKLRNAALSFQKQGQKASETPSNYFLIDTTGVSNNRPMVIQTVEEYMKKQDVKKKLAQEKKLKETSLLRKQAFDAAESLKHNSLLIQNGFLPIQGSSGFADKRPMQQTNVNTPSSAQNAPNIIPNQIVSVPAENAMQQQQQQVRQPQSTLHAFRRIVTPRFSTVRQHILPKKPMPNIKGFMYNSPILIPSARIKGPILISKTLPPKSRLAQLINHPYKIIPLASKRLIGRPIKAMILPSLTSGNKIIPHPFTNVRQFIRPYKPNMLSELSPSVNIDQKINQFINPNIAKGSYYTFREELEEAQRQKNEAPYIKPRPTVSPKEIMEAVKSPDWDKKINVPQQQINKAVYARRNLIPYQRRYITNIETHPVYSKIRALKKRRNVKDDESKNKAVRNRHSRHGRQYGQQYGRQRRSIDYFDRFDLHENIVRKRRSVDDIKELFQKYKSQHHSKQDIHFFIKRLKKRLLKLKKQREKTKELTEEVKKEQPKAKVRKNKNSNKRNKNSSTKLILHNRTHHKKPMDSTVLGDETINKDNEIEKFHINKKTSTSIPLMATNTQFNFHQYKHTKPNLESVTFSFNNDNMMKHNALMESNEKTSEIKPNNNDKETDFSDINGSGESMLYEELSSAAKQNHISIENAIASLKDLKEDHESVNLIKPYEDMTTMFMQRHYNNDNHMEHSKLHSAIKRKNFKKSEIEKFTFNTPRPVSQNIFNDMDMGAISNQDKKGQEFLTNSMELPTKNQHDLNFSSRKK